MKRTSISISEQLYSRVKNHALKHGLSMSSAFCQLSIVGLNEKSSTELAELIMERFDDNNLHSYVEGNFNVPREVVLEAIKQSIDSNEFDSLRAFAIGVGANLSTSSLEV